MGTYWLSGDAVEALHSRREYPKNEGVARGSLLVLDNERRAGRKTVPVRANKEQSEFEGFRE
jgi:hypothetical protein